MRRHRIRQRAESFPATEWEELSGLALPSAEIILDIFGARAQSREARIQVDLAHGILAAAADAAWVPRQQGGIGAKGEGESQLEQDKRTD
jgi:GTP-binding protein HflX